MKCANVIKLNSKASKKKQDIELSPGQQLLLDRLLETFKNEDIGIEMSKPQPLSHEQRELTRRLIKIFEDKIQPLKEKSFITYAGS